MKPFKELVQKAEQKAKKNWVKMAKDAGIKKEIVEKVRVRGENKT